MRLRLKNSNLLKTFPILLIFSFFVVGCEKTNQLSGEYNCNAIPVNEAMRGLKVIDPSFIFNQDSKIEYVLHVSPYPNLTVSEFGHYTINGNQLEAHYESNTVGNMKAESDDWTVRYTMSNVSDRKFSLEQTYDSQDNDNLWKLECGHR